MFQINTTESGDQKYVVTARLSNGNYVAVWSSDEGGADFSDQRTYGQIFTEGGTKVGPEFVVAYQPSIPDVTALSDGTFVVAWNGGQGQPLSVGTSDQEFVAFKYNNDGTTVTGFESPKTLFDPYYNAGRGELIETQRGELVGFFSLHSRSQDNLPGGSDSWETVAQRYDMDLNPVGSLVHVNTSVWGNQWAPGNGNITQTINGDLVFAWWSPVQSAGGASQAKLRVFDQDLTARTGEIDLIPSPTLGYVNTSVASLGGGGVAAAYSLDDGIGVKLLDASYNVVHSFSLSSGSNTFLTKLQREIVLTQVDEETFVLTWFEEHPDQTNGQLIDVKTQVFGNDGTPIGEARIVGQTGVGADGLDVEVSNGSLGISFSQVPSASDESVNGDGDGSGLFFERVSLGDSPSPDVHELEGHFYQVIDEAVTWEEALDASQGFTYQGMTGHLVTITSAPEQEFVTNLVEQHVSTGWDNASIWLAASDAQEEGVWRWMAGPEQGKVFWNGDGSGSPAQGMFSAWIHSYVVDENAAGGFSGVWTNPEGTGSDYAFLDALDRYSVDSNWDDAYSSTSAVTSPDSPVAGSEGMRNAFVVEYSPSAQNIEDEAAPTLTSLQIVQNGSNDPNDWEIQYVADDASGIKFAEAYFAGFDNKAAVYRDSTGSGVMTPYGQIDSSIGYNLNRITLIDASGNDNYIDIYDRESHKSIYDFAGLNFGNDGELGTFPLIDDYEKPQLLGLQVDRNQSDDFADFTVDYQFQDESGIDFAEAYFINESGHTLVYRDYAGDGEMSFSSNYLGYEGTYELFQVTLIDESGHFNYQDFRADDAGFPNVSIRTEANTSPELSRVIPGDGHVTTDLGGTEHAAGMVVMPDGRVVIAGWSDTNGSRDFTLTRYNPDGSLDASFGDSGSVITELSPFEDIAYTLTLQADGKLIAGGYTRTEGSVLECSLVRYNVDGSADLSFGVGGIVRTDLGGSDSRIYDLVALENGQILATGLAVSNGQRNTVVSKYNADGTLDQNFGSGGTVITDLGADSWGQALQPLGDSSILVAGHTDAGGFALLKYDLSGALDQSFGNNGVVVTTFAAPADQARDLLVQPDGKIVVAGQAWPNSDNRGFALARYEADGTLDVSFGDNGKLIEYFSASKDIAYGVALTQDGKLLAAGFSNNGVDRDFTIVQYNPDGTRDSDFGDDGVVNTNFSNGSGGSGNEAYSLEVLPDGRIVIAGFVEGGLGGDFAVARYNPDGTLDPTFGITYETRQDLNVVESQTLLTGSPDDVARAVLVQDDGKIVVAGYENSGSDGQFTLVRLNSDLSRDSAYGQGGLVKTDITASFDGINSAVLTADQKVVVVGYANGDSPYSGPTPTLAVARYDSAGLLDASFADGGLFVTNLGESTLIGNSVAIQGDGKVVVASVANVRGGYTELKLIRLNADGTLDEAFGDAGVATYVEHSQDYGNGVKDLSIKPDGSIVITGWLSETDAIPGFDLVLQTLQFRADGSLDTNFADGGVAQLALGDRSYGKALAVEGDGSFVVAMAVVDATGYVGDYGFRLIRYASDGQILAQTESFSSGGMLERPWKLVALSDGKLLLSGEYGEHNLQGTPLLMRFNSDLTLDETFFDDGRLLLSPENVAGTATDVAVLDNGDLVISGTVDSGLGDKDSVVYSVRESSGVSYTEGAPPVTLDSTIYVKDQELSDLGSYGGSSITFARQGGANAEDHFSLDPKALGTKAGDFKVSELAGFSVGDTLPDGRIATHQDVEAAAQRALHDLLALTAYENPQTDVLTVNAGRAQQLSLPDGSTVVVTTTSDPAGTFSGGVYVTLLDHERNVINQHMVSDGGTRQLRFAQVLSDGDIYIAWGVSGYKAALVSVDDGVITSTAPVTVSSNSSASVLFGVLEAPEGLVAFWDEGGAKKAQLLDSSDLSLVGSPFNGVPRQGGGQILGDGDLMSATLSGSFESGAALDDTLTYERFGFDYNNGAPQLVSKGVVAQKATEWTGSGTEARAFGVSDGSVILMWSANGQSFVQRVSADGSALTEDIGVHPTIDSDRNYPHISVDEILDKDGEIKAFAVTRISRGESSTDDGVFLQVYSPDLSLVQEQQITPYETSMANVSVQAQEDGSVNVMWKIGGNRVPLDEQTWTNVEVRPEVFDLRDGVEALSATQLSALEASGESAYWSETEITAAAALTEGGDVVISGQVIGSVTQNSGGQLRIDFASASSEQGVNQAIQAVQYRNVSNDPPATVTIDWTFNDGNVGDQGAGGSAQVTASTTVNITAVEDPPEPEVYEYNGHYYQVINEAVTWQEAMDLAAGSTYEGVEGHLVTVTSASEQAFVTNLVKEHVTTGWDNASIWLAASDAPEEGVWRWMAGPESGSNFWAGDGSGSPVAESFSAWINDYVVDENAASGGSGTWTNPEATGADYVFLDAIYAVDSNWDDAYSSTTASSSLTSPVASGDGLRNAYVIEYSPNAAPSFGSHLSFTEYARDVFDMGAEEFVTSSGPTQHGLAVQEDGKVIIVGTARSAGSANSEDFLLIRYNKDGTLDASFGIDGVVTTNFSSGGMDRGCAVTLLRDGTVVVAGQGNVANGSLSSIDGHVAWYTPSGDLLQTAVIDTGGSNASFGLIEMPDGSLIVGGRSDASTASPAGLLTFTRYLANGTLDTTFGDGGTVSQRIGDHGQSIGAMTLDGEGRIVIAGHYFDGSNLHFSVSRFFEDGSLDTEFNGSGYDVLTMPGFSAGGARDLLVLPDGGLLVVGDVVDANDEEVRSLLLARYNNDGTLNPMFGVGGVVVNSEANYGTALAQAADGSFVVGGASWNGTDTDYALFRYLPNGQLDTSFGLEGVQKIDLGRNDWLGDLAFIDDTTLVANGFMSDASRGHTANSDIGTVFLSAASAGYTSTHQEFVEGGGPVILDEGIQVTDANLHAFGTYAGSSITLARQGGADPEDRFTSNIGGFEDLSEESTLVVGGVSVGVVTQNSGGELRIDFAEGSTEELVNEVLQSISYSNTSDTPPTTVAIDWTFDDGNVGLQGSGGALAVTSTTTINITAVNDLPVGETYISGGLYVGQELTLVEGWSDAEGVDGEAHYQWRRLEEGVWVDIAGETGATYTLTAADEGHQVSAAISYLDLGGTDELIEATKVEGAIQPDSVLNGGGGADVLIGGSGDDVLWVEGNLGNPSEFWGARVVAPGAQASGGSGDDVFRFYTNQSSPWVAKQATIDGGEGVDALGINGEHGFDWDISALALNSVEELSLAWWQPSNALTVRMTSQQWSMFDAVNVEVANVDSGLTFIVDGAALSTEAVAPKLESFSVVAGDPFDFQGEDEDIYLGTLAEGETVAVAMPVVGRMNEAPDLVMGKGYVLSDMAGANEIGQELLVQADGKVVVAGLTKLLDGDEALALTRFNPDGSLDESFGEGGVVSTLIAGADSRIYGATQLESGQILVSGRTQGDNGFDAVFARYNDDGSIDNTFGESGLVRVDVGDVTTEFRAQAVDAIGGVVAVGKAGSEILITRLGPDGQLDTAFGGTGSVVSTLAPDFPAAADVLALADGSVVVAASVYQGTNSNFMLAKYAADGQLDATFGTSGYATVDLGSDFESAYGLIAQSDGGFVLAGYTLVNGTQDVALARFNADGALDTSFGEGGTVISDLTGRQDVITSVVTDSSDRIVVAGYSNNGADTDVTIARYLADGSLDATFGDGGWSTLSLPGGQWAYDVAILNGDKIAVAGYSRELVQGQGDDFLLARFNADGSLDDGFDNDLGREQVENGGPFLLNGGIQVFDSELDAAETYAGSWVSLGRRDAVDASDVFSAGVGSSLAPLDEGAPVVVGGTEIGLVAKNSGGELRVEFGTAATPALVNLALQGIAYQNTSEAPQAVVSLEWKFGDGNTGDQGGGGERVAIAQTQVHITAVNDEPVGGLEINGDFEQGRTLSATEAFDDADGRGSDPLSYQWYRGINEGAPDDIVVSEWTPVAGAVESTYLLTQADVGFVVSVGGTYVDNFLTPEEVFGEGAFVANVNDLPVGEVYVAGDYVQGQTLVASHDISDIDGLDPDAVVFRWERGLATDSSGQIDEGDWQTISGAYGAQYSLTQDDVDFDVRAIATYTDGQGTVERVVGESSPIANVNDAPTLTELEQTLPEQTEDDIAGAGQTVSNLLGDSFGDIDSGSAHGVAIHSTSGDFGAWEFSLDGGASWLSVGEVSEGSALLLDGEDSIRWVSDGTRGTTASLEYFAWDQTEFGVGQRIDATQRGGQTSLSVESAVATKVVAEVNDAPDGSISLGGTPAPGERLGVVREVTDVDGIIEESVTHRWLIGEDFDNDGEIVDSEKTIIAIAEDSQYTIGIADSGKTLFAEMTYLDGGGTTETIQSEGVEVYWPDPELRLVQGDSGQLSIQTGWVGAAWTINYSVLVRGATIDAVTIGDHPAAWSVEANSFNDPLTSQLVVAAYSTGDPSTGYPMVGGGEFISVEVTPHVDASNVTVSILPGATAMYAESDFETEIDTSLSFEIAVGATVSVESADVEVVEGGDGSTTTVEYVIHLDRAVNIDHQIAWSVAGVGGFAVDGEDFAIGEVPSGVLEIKAGETSGVISFEVNGDGLVEGDEAFEVSLVGSSGLNLSGLDTLTGAILNDDKSKVTIDAASTLLPEGDIGVTYYTFDVNLDQAAVVDQSVNWRIDYLNDLWSDPDFLPVSAADFAVDQAFSGVLEFGAGETHKEIVIGVKGDLVKEGRETFGLEIFDPSMGLEIGEGQGTVEIQIKDDDGFDVGGKVYFWGGDNPERQWLMDDVDVGVVSLVGRSQEEVNQNPVRLHNIKLDSQTSLGTAELWVEGSADTVEGVTSFSFNCLLPDGSTFVPTVSAEWQITQAFSNGVLSVSGIWTGAEGGQNVGAVRIGEVAFSVPDPVLDMRFDVLDSQIANDSGGEYVSGSVIEARMTHEGVTYVEAGDISGSGSYFATALPEATYEIGMDKSIELYQFDASGVRTWSKEVRALTAADARETLLISLGKEVSGEALIAADVNKSGTVTAADARDILLMSVKDQTRLEEKLDWVFVSEDADLSGLTRRDVREGEDWVQGHSLYLQDDQTSENLVAILMGDVNASYTPLIQQVPEI